MNQDVQAGGKATPDYFKPDHFSVGQAVTYGEFKATIVRHYSEGMWEIRLAGGIACVTGSDIEAT